MLRGYSIVNKDNKVITSTHGTILSNSFIISSKLCCSLLIFTPYFLNYSIYITVDNETVSLEESLDLYQRGMKLSSACDKTLKDAEISNF
jgi:hypothetical protein